MAEAYFAHPLNPHGARRKATGCPFHAGLTMEEMLGNGANGTVHLGRRQSSKVAVKEGALSQRYLFGPSSKEVYLRNFRATRIYKMQSKETVQ